MVVVCLKEQCSDRKEMDPKSGEADMEYDACPIDDTIDIPERRGIVACVGMCMRVYVCYQTWEVVTQ